MAAGKARVQKRLYYKIGEACKALGIQPYVLRYWETEFPALVPTKSRSGQRVYSEKEMEIIRRIKELLYDEGYTIAGAKKKLEGELASGTFAERDEDELETEVNEVEESPAPASARARRAAPKAPPEPVEMSQALLLHDAGAAPPPMPQEAPLDTDTSERIQTLRSGIAKALDEAREILVLLDTKPR
jgi:DNA-binding transcriptional MerR regulator